MWVGTGGWASSTASAPFHVSTAFRGNESLHDHLGGVHFWALLARDTTTIWTSAEMSLLASTTGYADARADGIGLVAGAIAPLALTEFFVLLADLWWQWHGFVGWHAALHGRHAHAMLVLQVAWLAEAADDALQGAGRAWMWVGTGWGAGRSAGQEDFIFLALGHFWWIGEEHAWLSFALEGWHANALRVSQKSLLAETSNNAVLGAAWAWMWVGAGRSAGRTASLEFFIVGASWERKSRWDLEWEFVVGFSITFVRLYALAHFVLQVSFSAETTAHALKGTNFGDYTVLASGRAR